MPRRRQPVSGYLSGWVIRPVPDVDRLSARERPRPGRIRSPTDEGRTAPFETKPTTPASHKVRGASKRMHVLVCHRGLASRVRYFFGSPGKGAQPASIDPGGVPAVSRWLSAATPPVLWPNAASTPIGVAAVSIEIPRILVHSERRLWLRLLPGSFRLSATATGGVAALNHRLMATTPPGSWCAHLPDEPFFAHPCPPHSRSRARTSVPVRRPQQQAA